MSTANPFQTEIATPRWDVRKLDYKTSFRWVFLFAAWVWFPIFIAISPMALSSEGRWVLVILVGAIAGWIGSKINDTLIAAVAGFALVLSKAMPARDLKASMGADIIWLMVAAFILAFALKETGVVQKSASLLFSRTNRFRVLMHGLTFIIFLTAFMIPSTSARAALFLPVYQLIATHLTDNQKKMLALVIPTAVLLTAVGSVTGAGAHLAAIEFLKSLGHAAPGFGSWMLLMAPAAILSAHIATEVILRLFATSDDHTVHLSLDALKQGKDHSGRWPVLGILFAVLVGWMSEPVHGLSAADIAWLGVIALLLALPKHFNFKAVLKSVEWELILFLALTLALGRAIAQTDLDEWCVALLRQATDGRMVSGSIGFMCVIIVVSLLAHLVITSRTARVTVLVPALVLPAQAFGLDPMITALTIVMATGFCQTLPASAKPVALFSGLEPQPYSPADLACASGILFPIMAILLAVMAGGYWPLLKVWLVR
ncbi:MAG: SLC13 family permease [Beijerinckiaceae bacterium]